MAVTYEEDFFAGRSEFVRQSAAVVVPIICELFDPKSVLDLGCGQGEWLDAFPCDDKLGVDISGGRGVYGDLRERLYLGQFDIVLSLEVGEHLPEDDSDTYVANIVRHSDTVVFSAAVPGQEGKGHINCQPHEYWHEKFADWDFACSDDIRPRIAGDTHVSPWYRDNIFVYRWS